MAVRHLPIALLLTAAIGCGPGCERATRSSESSAQPAAAPAQLPPWPRESDDAQGERPRPAPAELVELVGEYGSDNETVYVFERAGNLWLLVDRRSNACRLSADQNRRLHFVADSTCGSRPVLFT